MNRYIEEYLNYLENIKMVSANTLASYKRDIKGYFEYIESSAVGTVEGANSTIILNYLLSIQKNGKSASTASRTLASIRSLYRYLTQKGYISADPTYDLHGFKADRRPPRALTDEQVQALLDAPVLKNIKGYRDKAILELMYATGMRASDVIGIRIKDVNLKVGYIYCMGGDGKKYIVPIYAFARECLQQYMDKRREIANSSNTDFLFLNLNGSPLSRQGLWKIIKGYQKKLGISVEITPHSLRHSFAIHLLENGADLKSVQELLGHKDISSTRIYEQTVKNKLSEVYEKSHPRARYGKQKIN